MDTIAARDLVAVDGAPVNGVQLNYNRLVDFAIASFVVSVTGGPTTYDMRAAIEGSVDGVNWTQLVRFADVTNAAPASRYVRTSGVVVGAEFAYAASALGSAQASPGVITESPWPIMVRAVTKLQTLTGGTTPHVISAVTLGVR